MNPMKQVRIEKVTLNIGSGKDQNKLEKGLKLLNSLSNQSAVKTITQKRIAGWGIRPGLPVGCKLTLRHEQAKEMFMRCLDAKSFSLSLSQFDDTGSISFGITEYIDIKDAKYDPEIGILGLQVCLTLERPGFRIKRRRYQKKKIPAKCKITKEEAAEYLKANFKVKIDEE